mgnify:CR=1 FL=1
MPSSAQIHTVYKNKAGKRICSVTTYLAILAKPAIIHWAWEQGVAGLDYRKVRDQAGDTGTLVHYLIMCQLRGEEPALADYSHNEVAATYASMSKFNQWVNGKVIEPFLLETPLVSEAYQFGGTPDFYGKVDDVLTLADFKTSGAVYAENFYQLAAYKKLLEEYGHRVDSSLIIRVGKTEGEGFEERAVGNLEKHWELFLLCQQIYNLQAEMRKTKDMVEE